jgi:PAS domain S-box-containing protein
MSGSCTFVVIRSVAVVSLIAGVCLLATRGAAASQTAPSPKTVLILRAAAQSPAPALIVQQIQSGLLDGRNPVDLPPTTTASLTAFDWRELQRFRIAEAALPPGSTVQYREPDFWSRRGWLIGIVALLLADAALLAALISQLRRRRRLEASITRRLRFETLLSDLLLAFAKIPASQTGPALDASLRRVAGDVDVDAVWLWELGDARDPEWTSLRLQSGEAIVLDGADDLPRPLREKLTQAPRVVGSIAATPLDVSGVVLGALFSLSSRNRSSWSPEMFEHLRMISDVFANVVQRKHADIALQQSDRLKGAILSSLPAQVAVLDRSGTIIAVNDVWANGEHGTGGCAGHAMSAGGSYLEACGAALTRAGASEAAEILAGVTAVCEGRSRDFECEYRCDAPASDRWFVMRVTPLRSEAGGAVVTHWDVTERKHAEIVVRESEDQYRRLADALPIGVWMSGTDGACYYFNKTWLELTGRRLDQELGSGWIEGVHPDDRESSLGAYMRAFAAHEPFSIEYRLRRHDGQYRWVLDRGVPRFGADGTFLGYVGGVVDLTARRHAEQALRALSGRLIGAQEDERRRIARELHDNLGQRLALLSMALDRFAVMAPESVSASVADLRTKTGEIAHEVHTLSHRLHSSKLDALGLVAAVRGHCQEVSQHGLEVRFVDSDVPKTLPSETALCVFRIAQEALTNVVKHSGAAEARVWLSSAHDTLVLRVEDTGRGFDTAAHNGGLGLVSMHERLRSIGGEMTVRSSPGHGTTIEARVPIRAALRADEPSSRAELRTS